MSEIEMVIRPAAPGDANGINAVYNPFIRDSAVTFETLEYSDKARRIWLRDHEKSTRHPVIVAERADGVLCGFASASAFDQRGAYETSVKTSVSFEPVCHGAGVATKLYAALFDALGRADVHRAYALIVAPNPGSVALHKAFAFTKVATLNEVGRKFGHFYDVIWFEKHL